MPYPNVFRKPSVSLAPTTGSSDSEPLKNPGGDSVLCNPARLEPENRFPLLSEARIETLDPHDGNQHAGVRSHCGGAYSHHAHK